MPVSRSVRKAKKKKNRRRSESYLDDEEFFADLVIPGEMFGLEKMSEVLVEFARPYGRLPTSEAGYQMLYTLAALAWNAALFPPSEREQKLAELFQKAGEDLPNESRLIIRDLIDRKERYFAEYTRTITNCQVRMEPEGVRVFVESTLESPRRTSRFRRLREWLGGK